MTPGMMLDMTVRAQEFMFQSQLTATIANKASEGITNCSGNSLSLNPLVKIPEEQYGLHHAEIRAVASVTRLTPKTSGMR